MMHAATLPKKLAKQATCKFLKRIIEEPFQNVMVIRVIASTTVVDKEYTFRSEIIWKDEELNLKIGEVVKILIDYSNPENYYFDPKQIEY